MYFKVTRESNNPFTETELVETIKQLINSINNTSVQSFIPNSVYSLTISKDSFLAIAIVQNNNDAGIGNLFKVIFAARFNADNVLIYTQNIYIGDNQILTVLPQLTTTKLVSNTTWDTSYHNMLWL